MWAETHVTSQLHGLSNQVCTGQDFLFSSIQTPLMFLER
jgi:hypothetical protein